VKELTNCHNTIEKSPSWDDRISPASQEIPCILWNQKIQHCVHKSPPIGPVLIQMNLVHAIQSYLFKAHFNIYISEQDECITQMILSKKTPINTLFDSEAR